MRVRARLGWGLYWVASLLGLSTGVRDEAASHASGITATSPPTRVETHVETDIDAAELLDFLRSPRAMVLDEQLFERAELLRFYAGRGGRAVFAQPDDASHALEAILQTASAHGLRPADYHAGALRATLHRATQPDTQPGAHPGAHLAVHPPLQPSASLTLAQASELALADGLVRLARHLSTGFVDPRRLHPRYARGEIPPDPIAALEQVAQGAEPAEAIAAFAPAHPEYAGLRAALAQLRQQRLERRSESAEAAQEPLRAVKYEEGIDRVRINLERWRWQPRDFGSRYLRVDIPRYSMRAFLAGSPEPILEMKAVVGRADWRTPMLHAVLDSLVVNPSWVVPRSIFAKEMVPRARRDAGYFAAEGLELRERQSGVWRRIDPASIDWTSVDLLQRVLRVEQRPGPDNPLGRIKFPIRSPYGVHLHGTPARAAFEREERALSHGCIRVEDELALARFALASDAEWNGERLARALAEETDRRVTLAAPLAIHVVYFTAEIDRSGTLTALPDPYSWDPALLALLGPEEVAP